jgi:ligand-binding sensor domain-containing protein
MLIMSVKVSLAQRLPAIGQWRDHLPMKSVLSLTTDNNSLLAGSAYGYFEYEPSTKQIITKTKSDGLSQVELKWISKNPISEKLLLVYQNEDLDLVSGDRIRNLPDLIKTNLQEDKTVNHINWIGDDAYLSTNLGIIVVNTDRLEIKNTYRIGENGKSIKVFQTVLLNGVLFAATERGLLRANFSSSGLNDFRNWTAVSNQFNNSPTLRVLNWNNQLVTQVNDSLFINRNGSWSLLFANQRQITTLAVVNNQLFIGQVAQGNGSAVLINPITQVLETITSNYLTHPTDAVYIQGTIWVSDLKNGVVNLSNANEMPVFPETPAGLAFGDGFFADGTIYVTSGKFSRPNNLPSFADAVYTFNGDNWKSLNSTTTSVFDTLKDIGSVVYQSASGSLFAGADDGGLLEIVKDGKLVVYKQNSLLSPVFNNAKQYSVGGLALDKEQQLWITNNGAQDGLVVKKSNGTAQKFRVPFVYTNFGLSKLIIDDLNRKWIVSANGDGLFCFDHGGSLEVTSDDRWRQFKQGLGRGNLPSNNVLSIACDRNGFIWVGTDKGVAVIQCGDDVFNAGTCEAILPVVQEGNFAGRLLAEEKINDIKIDGADRKWIATSNGVWLLSADGQKVINRFIVSNSKLLSNEVFSIVIEPFTGEVFFMTGKGICSYRSTATEPVIEMKKPFIFPNPVPPGFSGTIAIRDLPEQAWVSITELDGRLVFKTRSLGGQATWNGKNYKGERVSSGTYLVMVANELNTQQVVGKIFFLK